MSEPQKQIEPPTSTPAIEVTRTYLEMRNPSELNGAKLDDPMIRIDEQPDCSIELFRFLYAKVGENYHWIDRLLWTDEEIVAYLNRPEISVWLMTYEGARGIFRTAQVRRRIDRDCLFWFARQIYRTRIRQAPADLRSRTSLDRWSKSRVAPYLHG